MRGDVIVPETILKIAALVIGILVLIAFVNFVNRFAYTKCWSDTITEWETIKEAIKSEQDKEYDVSMRSGCLNSISEMTQDKCNDACTNLKSEKASYVTSKDDLNKYEQKCRTQCTACQDAKTCWVAVPKIPSSWNYFLVWNVLDTMRARDTTLKTFKIDQDVNSNFPAVPSTGYRNYCIDISRSDTVYSMTPKEGRCA